MKNKKRFNQIVKDIKNVKIQGAKAIAKNALYAYRLYPTKHSKKKLLSLRPTEPLLKNVLEKADNQSDKEILSHFDFAQKIINEEIFNLINNNDVVFTHCHSSTVVEALIYSKKSGKKFEVYNTETRPLFQGKKTARELKNAGIRVTHFVDSAAGIALSKEQGTKKVDKVFLGSDALLKKGVVNKVGSETICILAKKEKIPVYILADSWKYSKKPVELEQRNWKEIWKSPKKIINLRIANPSFEFIPKTLITRIVTELGVQKYGSFLRTISKS